MMDEDCALILAELKEIRQSLQSTFQGWGQQLEARCKVAAPPTRSTVTILDSADHPTASTAGDVVSSDINAEASTNRSMKCIDTDTNIYITPSDSEASDVDSEASVLSGTGAESATDQRTALGCGGEIHSIDTASNIDKEHDLLVHVSLSTPQVFDKMLPNHQSSPPSSACLRINRVVTDTDDADVLLHSFTTEPKPVREFLVNTTENHLAIKSQPLYTRRAMGHYPRIVNWDPGIDAVVSTAEPEKELPLVTDNTNLSILAADYPIKQLACYLSDEQRRLLTH